MGRFPDRKKKPSERDGFVANTAGAFFKALFGVLGVAAGALILFYLYLVITAWL